MDSSLCGLEGDAEEDTGELAETAPYGALELMETMPPERVRSVLSTIMGSGHFSTLEHASYTFGRGVFRLRPSHFPYDWTSSPPAMPTGNPFSSTVPSSAGTRIYFRPLMTWVSIR